MKTIPSDTQADQSMNNLEHAKMVLLTAMLAINSAPDISDEEIDAHDYAINTLINNETLFVGDPDGTLFAISAERSELLHETYMSLKCMADLIYNLVQADILSKPDAAQLITSVSLH